MLDKIITAADLTDEELMRAYERCHHECDMELAYDGTHYDIETYCKNVKCPLAGQEIDISCCTEEEVFKRWKEKLKNE